MRLFITFILGMFFWASYSMAQEDKVNTATTALQNVLSNLKESVEQLSSDNDQLTARDNAMKSQLLQLQTQLNQVESQGDFLNKSAAKLQDKNPRRAQQITRLEEDNYELDNRTQKAEVTIKSIQQAVGAGYQEEQRLLFQLKGMTNLLPTAPPGPSPATVEEEHRQKERLRLIKMIYDCQQRQESLQAAMLETQKNMPLVPAASAMARQQTLKQQIKDLQGQMADYPAESVSAHWGYANQWDDNQLRQLEGELKILERNYLQLKDLMAQMTKKAQSIHLTVTERVEEAKLQGSIIDLKNQTGVLKATLEDLRSQMVDLDKRKTHLETMVK